MMNKNEKVIVTIDDIGVGGEGIGKVDGYTLFVKDAIIGDTVEAVITKPKKNYAYAKMLKVLTASPDRVEKKCPVARQCGGCQIQEMSYEAQLDFKALYEQKPQKQRARSNTQKNKSNWVWEDDK